MIIDAHVHFRQPKVEDDQDLWEETCKTFDKMFTMANSCGITNMCILAQKDLLYKLLEKYPEDIFGYI